MSADKARRTMGRAKKIGLFEPAKLLAGEMDAAKLTVLSMEKVQRRGLPQASGAGPSRGRKAIKDSAYEDEEDALVEEDAEENITVARTHEDDDEQDSDGSVYVRALP